MSHIYDFLGVKLFYLVETIFFKKLDIQIKKSDESEMLLGKLIIFPVNAVSVTVT